MKHQHIDTSEYRDGLAARIETLFIDLEEKGKAIRTLKRRMADAEATAKVEHVAAWETAKNDNVRKTLLDTWLAEDMDYHDDRAAIHELEDDMASIRLEIECVNLLVRLNPQPDL